MKTRTGKLLFGLAIAGVALLAYKAFKKECKKLRDAEKEETEELEALGVSQEKLQNDMIPEEDDNNLVKRLFHSVKFNSQWDEDLLDVKGFLENENVIHVRQSDTSDTLDFLIEIPEVSLDDENKRSPKIGEYITSCSAAKIKMWKDIVGEDKCPEPYSELEGYFVVAYELEPGGEEQNRIVKIPRRLYQEYATEKHNGLTEYIKLVRSGVVKQKLDPRDVFSRYEYEGDEEVNVYNVRAIHVQTMYRISFHIRRIDGLGRKTPGIDLPRALKCLRYLVDEFSVTRGMITKTYDHIIFHSPGDYEKWNLLWYYTTAVIKDKGVRERIIVSDNYVY